MKSSHVSEFVRLAAVKGSFRFGSIGHTSIRFFSWITRPPAVTTSLGVTSKSAWAKAAMLLLWISLPRNWLITGEVAFVPAARNEGPTIFTCFELYRVQK